MEDEENRMLFERQLLSIWKRKTQNCVLLNRAEYNAKLQRLIELENPQCPKTAQDFRLLKLYNYIIQDNGGHKSRRLCKRGTSFLFVPIEEMYDILKSAHIQLGHAGRNSMQVFFRHKYCNLTKDCIMTFLALCKQCPRKKKIREVRPKSDSVNVLDGLELMDDEDEIDVDGTLQGSTPTLPTHFSSSSGSTGLGGNNSNWRKDSNHLNGQASSSTVPQLNDTFTRGQVDIIDMRKQPDNEFTYIFKYLNLQTSEIRLKPMQFGTPMEAASLLIDIYCEQGAPVVLQSYNGRDFVKEVVSEISKLWPNCKQLHGALRGTPNTDFADNGLILEQLVVIQKRLNTNVWAHLLRFLQWEINSSYNSELGRSVLENAYGKQPSLGLPSSKLLEAVYDKAQSEEQMLDYIADAELLRLSAFCSNAFQQAQQNMLISNSSSAARIEPPRPRISATASITVNPGHFIDQNQLMILHQDNKAPQGLMGQPQLAAASRQTSPPVFMDYRSLHMSVEQERQQQQQQQHSAHHSVQHSPVQQQSSQPVVSQPGTVYLQQVDPPQPQNPPPQQPTVYIQTSMDQQQSQASQQSQPPPPQPNPRYVEIHTQLQEMIHQENNELSKQHEVVVSHQQQSHMGNGPMDNFPL